VPPSLVVSGKISVMPAGVKPGTVPGNRLEDRLNLMEESCREPGKALETLRMGKAVGPGKAA
jgi:hypothetical protein